MLNIEKYKDEIMKSNMTDITCCVNDDILCNTCYEKCRDCKERVMEWLLSEAKEPILDDVEKEYLSAVIKPFRKKVKHIVKINLFGSPEEQFIRIEIGNSDFINLPNFNKNTGMYKGMGVDKFYSLEELGL